MEHTPYGYEIEGGRAVVNPEKAAILRTTYENYIAGKSLMNAADEAGLRMQHAGVKRIFQNRKYLGTDYYPAIFTEEEFKRFEEERKRREVALGRTDKKGKKRQALPVQTAFQIKAVKQKYKNPARQAEYAYSQVREAEGR